MAAGPLNIQTGFFLTSSIWLGAPNAQFGDKTKTVTLTSSGPNPGLSVRQGAKHVFHSQLTNRRLRYQILGDKYLVILDISSLGGSSTRTITLVDFTSWREVLLATASASTATALPVVNASKGNGAAFLLYLQGGGQHTHVAIRRSDVGTPLCSLGVPIVPTGQTSAEATDSKLVIHYSTGGVSRTRQCLKPQ
jgi:hypothetical protein